MDEKADNPYQSPQCSPRSRDEPFEVHSLATGQPSTARGWIAILTLTILFGFVAAMSLMAFVFQLNHRLPGGESYFATEPMWVFSHLIRGTALSFLTFFLCRYALAVRQQSKQKGPLGDRFWRAHARVWNCGALVMLVLLLYSIIFTVMR